LHALTYRFKGHVSVDPGTYRDPAEVQAAYRKDPLPRTRARLAELGVADSMVESIELEVNQEIESALAVAKAAPWPEVREAYEDVMTTTNGVWR
jgi:acetoin:2,6-dichlorophenolindophenol oxidoreductase subunit alpha